MTKKKKRKINYYVFHSGSGTIIDANDGVTVFSDEDWTDEEIEALDDGDTSVAELAGINLMTVVRYYEKESYMRTIEVKHPKKSKKGKGKRK